MTDKQMRNAIDRRQKVFDTLLSTAFKQIQVLHDSMKLILVVSPSILCLLPFRLCRDVRLFHIRDQLFVVLVLLLICCVFAWNRQVPSFRPGT